MPGGRTAARVQIVRGKRLLIVVFGGFEICYGNGGRVKCGWVVFRGPVIGLSVLRQFINGFKQSIAQI